MKNDVIPFILCLTAYKNQQTYKKIYNELIHYAIDNKIQIRLNCIDVDCSYNYISQILIY